MLRDCGDDRVDVLWRSRSLAKHSTTETHHQLTAVSTAVVSILRRIYSDRNIRVKRNLADCGDSLCFPAVSREEKVNTAIVDVGGVLQEAVDHLPNRCCSILTDGGVNIHPTNINKEKRARCSPLI